MRPSDQGTYYHESAAENPLPLALSNLCILRQGKANENGKWRFSQTLVRPDLDVQV